MAIVFGTLQASAYSTFFLGIWAICISLALSLVSMAAILLSRFSNPTATATPSLPESVKFVSTAS